MSMGTGVPLRELARGIGQLLFRAAVDTGTLRLIFSRVTLTLGAAFGPGVGGGFPTGRFLTHVFTANSREWSMA